MSSTDRDLIAELATALRMESYSPVVVRNYCAYAQHFLAHLARYEVPVTAVTPEDVAHFMRHAVANFRDQRGRPPGPNWHSIPRAGIHALLHLAQGQWPPDPDVVGPEAMLRHDICRSYQTWLREERGLATASITAYLAEARHFLAWQLDRGGT